MSQTRRFSIKRDLSLLYQRCEAQMTFVYHGGLFCSDAQTLSYAQCLQDGDTVLDLNKTPCVIESVQDFQTTLKQKHRQILNEYHEEYKKIAT